MGHHLLESYFLFLNIFLCGNHGMVTLIEKSPVIFKALASQNLHVFRDNSFQNESTTTDSDSLILIVSVFYKGKPIFRNLDNNVFKG